MSQPDNNDTPLWFKKIEDDAGYYEPASYDLLTFYHMLETQGDSFSSSFIPLTSVLPTLASETKILAVGLLPPAVRPSGRILNRSATIRSYYGPSLDSAASIAAAQVEEVQGNAVNSASNGSGLMNIASGPDQSATAPTSVVARRSDQLQAGLHASIQPLVTQLIQLAAQQGINLVVVEGYRSTEYQDQLYAQGRTAPGPIVTGTKGGESWHNFGLAFDVAMVAPGPQPPAGSPSWPPGKDLWQTVGQLGESVGLGWGGHFPKLADYGHFEFHPGLTKEQARQGARPEVAAEGPKPVQETALPADDWKATGADNAVESAKTADQRANRDPMQSDLGKRFAQAQEQLVALTNAAIQAVANTKPLRMLVNPASFRVSAEPITSEGNWGRTGPIVEFWGSGQDRIEASGKVAGYYSMDSTDGSGPGLTRTARQFSQSYQNLLSLWLIYKNNAGIYIPDYLSSPAGSRNKSLSVVGSVYLYYDDILYIGSFDSFSVTESDSAPYTVEYQFSFVVRAWYLLDHPNSPQYTYGVG